MTSQAPAADDAADEAAATPLPTLDDVDRARPKDDPRPAVDGAAPGAAELGGRGGLDPTRYGDWELKGRCIDF